MKIKENVKPLLGAHYSISRGLHRAIDQANSHQCTALQIFTKNARSWKEKWIISEEISSFIKAWEKTDIQTIISHTSYLVNLASIEKKKYDLSYNALKMELERCSALNISLVVMHPGAHMGEGQEPGTQRIARGINNILNKAGMKNTRLLLETTAGQGTSIGHTFDQLKLIMDQVDRKNKIGICLDSCHIFAAGYDIRTRKAYEKTIHFFDRIIGLGNLFLIHLNDSKMGLNSRVDRHEHIGRGTIGLNAFKYFMKDPRFLHIPKIIETPKKKNKEDWDNINLNILRDLYFL